ncbi:hypothetical protein [Altererythrobacter sp. GH1-8]|uniref:hypothetical protein n=1 Tax=Altererythrobacter sp. GH1-8 TaxID=3349333 RepID=UPI00374CDAAE
MMSERMKPRQNEVRTAAEIRDQTDCFDIVSFQSTAHEVEDHQFTKTDPRTVFLLAFLAGMGAVLALAAAHWLMERSIDVGLMPPAPALQKYVD